MDQLQRVIYQKNPLVEVILQVKFPTILSINAREPVDFQDAIRREYPIYQLALENEQEISIAVGGDGMLPSVVQKQQHKNHNFISEDGLYKVNLTSGFIAISTLNYTCWEDMLNRLKTPLEKFIEIYKPAFFERIGLRYIDAFSREKLGIQGKPWCELIQPKWLGALSSVEEGKVVHSGTDIEYFLDNDVSRVKVHAGLGNVNNDPEQVFIIDSDFIHIENVKVEEFEEIIGYLHDNSSQFIRTAITEVLHEAMLPGELK